MSREYRIKQLTGEEAGPDEVLKLSEIFSIPGCRLVTGAEGSHAEYQ